MVVYTVPFTASRGVDFIGSLREKPTPEEHPWGASAFVYDPQPDRYVCPQGKLLRPEGWQTRGGVRYHRYRARRRDCESCPLKAACCPGHHSRNLLRSEPSPAVEAFRQKMSTAEAKALYRKRGPVVEFCHAWIKCKLGLRQFHVRGLVKVKAEMLWAALTYNIPTPSAPHETAAPRLRNVARPCPLPRDHPEVRSLCYSSHRFLHSFVAWTGGLGLSTLSNQMKMPAKNPGQA